MKLLDINDNPFPDDDLHYKVCFRAYIHFGFTTIIRAAEPFHLPGFMKTFCIVFM